MRVWLGALVLAMNIAGCNRYVVVEPMELARVTATQSSAPRSLRTVDGELVEVEGEFDVIVRTASGDYEFSRPVSAWLAPGTLVVAGGNEPARGLPLAEIERVEIKQFSPGRTVALVVPISAVAVVLVLLGTGTAGH